MELTEKTAIVTGPGSGFGAGIARVFAAEGAQVMVADINSDAAEDVARVREFYGATYDFCRERFGAERIDRLWTNAGTRAPVPAGAR